MVDRFTTMLDCVDIGFLPDGILDQLPQPSQIGAVRVGGLDTNKPRTRAAMAAVTALAVAPDGFTVADFAAQVRAPHRRPSYTVRQAAYDLRKLRGKQLVVKPGRGPPLPGARRRRPHHHRPDQPPRPRHRTRPRRRPQTRRPTTATPTPASTATTTPSAPACAHCSPTSASAPPHRQQIVDQMCASL